MIASISVVLVNMNGAIKVYKDCSKQGLSQGICMQFRKVSALALTSNATALPVATTVNEVSTYKGIDWSEFNTGITSVLKSPACSVRPKYM